MASASSVRTYDADHTSDDDSDDYDDSYDDDTSSNDWYPPEGFGLLPYQYEPVYTGEELRQRDLERQRAAEEPQEAAEDRRQQDVKIWCGCGNCDVMDTARECRCCREMEKTDRKRKATDPTSPCITLHPGFNSVCLDLHVLQTSYFAYRQHYGHYDSSDHIHKRYIHTAKRQLVLWCGSFVGKSIKTPIPACVLIKIRKQFPNQEKAEFKYPTTDD